MRRSRIAVVIVGFTALASVAGCGRASQLGANLQAEASPKVAPSEGGVIVASSRNRRAAQTADDWATYADHVLVITVVGEIKVPPSDKEVARGEGLVGRIAVIRVDDVVWSAKDAPMPAPSGFEMQVGRLGPQ